MSEWPSESVSKWASENERKFHSSFRTSKSEKKNNNNNTITVNVIHGVKLTVSKFRKRKAELHPQEQKLNAKSQMKSNRKQTKQTTLFFECRSQSLDSENK